MSEADFDALAAQIAQQVIAGTASGGKTPMASYSEAELRQLWRAGRITEAEWNAELVARGSTAQAATDQIARAKNVGISTDVKTKGQLTPSEAAAVNAFKASAPAPTPVPANAGAQGASAGAGAAGDYSLAPSNAGNASASATATGSAGGTNNLTAQTPDGADPVGPGGRSASAVRAASVAGQELLPGEREWYLSLDPALRAKIEGAPTTTGTATGSGAPTLEAKGPSTGIKGIADSFTGFSDKDVIAAYYKGEIDEPTLRAVLDYRNTDTNKTTGVVTRKYTDASLNRLMDQINADKPLGVTKGDIEAQFDSSRADFGARGTFGSSTAGQGIREQGLFTPQSGGSGFVPVTNTAPQGGGIDSAAAVVGNQLYTPQQIAFIAQQRGMNPKSTLSDIGQSLADQNYFMERYGASPSQANTAVNVASGAYNVANDRIDPASGRPAGEMNQEELLRLAASGVFKAAGGPVRAGMPYVTGEIRPELYVPSGGRQPMVVGAGGPQAFTPPADGTILPKVPFNYHSFLENRPYGGVMKQPKPSIFEKALLVNMRRKPLGMVG